MTDEGQPDEGHSDRGESHSELFMSLEEAVKEYPTRAVEKLAAVLGLVEENFTAFYQRAARCKDRPQKSLEKRPQLQADRR
jgi:pyruvate kinase